MTEVQANEEPKTPAARPNFSYRGMNQVLLDTLRFDSNFETNLTDILVRAGLRTSLRLLVTGQGHLGEATEGISLVSYNRFSVSIAYCESGVPGLNTAYVQIECPGNVGAAQILFEKLRASGVPGGETGCTAEPDRTFVTRHNLAGPYAVREKPAAPPSASTDHIKSKAQPRKENPPTIPEKASPKDNPSTLAESMKKAAELLNLSDEGKSQFLSGSATPQAISGIIAMLTQKGEYVLALTIRKAFL